MACLSEESYATKKALVTDILSAVVEANSNLRSGEVT